MKNLDGIDPIEVIVALEHAFAISLHDAEAEQAESMGMLYALVLRKTRLSESDATWRRFQNVVAEACGSKARDVTANKTLLQMVGSPRVAGDSTRSL